LQLGALSNTGFNGQHCSTFFEKKPTTRDLPQEKRQRPILERGVGAEPEGSKGIYRHGFAYNGMHSFSRPSPAQIFSFTGKASTKQNGSPAFRMRRE